MRRFTFFILLSLTVLNAMGQNDFLPMLVDGHSWRYEHLTPNNENMAREQTLNSESTKYAVQNFMLKVEGDAEFDGNQCKKIIFEGPDVNLLYAYGYEEDGKVMLYALSYDSTPDALFAFYAPFPTGQWVTLYDFNADKDSHCEMAAFKGREMIVSEKGTHDVNGVSHDYIGLRIASYPSWPLYYALEGIGSSFGLYEFTNLITDGSGSRFVGYYDGETCLFSINDFNSLATGISITPSATKKDTNRQSIYYSISGLQLPALQRGINIVRMTDGKTKKVVIK